MDQSNHLKNLKKKNLKNLIIENGIVLKKDMFGLNTDQNNTIEY